MCTADGRLRIGDISNVGPTVTIRRGHNEVRVWNVIWYLLASDGTDWSNTFQTGYLTGPVAQRVAALSLHHFDISFCERILNEHHSKFVNEYNDLSLALWISVITKFMSCFQYSKARPPLDPQNVFGANSTTLQDFQLIRAMRDKHVVHDENSHYNAAAFAWIKPNGDVYGVGPMIAVARIDPTLVEKIRNLVARAQDYIQNEMEEAGKELLDQVQAMSLDERTTLPKGVYFVLPSEDDINKTR